MEKYLAENSCHLLLSFNLSVCSVTVSFDLLHFEALVHRAIRLGTEERQCLLSLDNLLGERWYVRGLNFVMFLAMWGFNLNAHSRNPTTISRKWHHETPGFKYQLVFKSDGALAEWSSHVSKVVEHVNTIYNICVQHAYSMYWSHCNVVARYGCT